MGIYWRYFRDTLRWPLLLHPGPLAALVEGAASALDAARLVILILRDQFLPARCEDAYLARFARSRGIVRNPLEPDEHWLGRVRFAYHWWSRGGRASALAEGLRIGFGFSWVQVDTANTTGDIFDELDGAGLVDELDGAGLEYNDNARWAEFFVTCGLGLTDQFDALAAIIWAINEVKPARSKLAGIVFIHPLFDELDGAALIDETTGAPLTVSITLYGG